jgi:tetratricopeptide (TPR) repeat protein
MKRVLLILWLSGFAAALFANTDSLFQTANGLYQEGSYELALNAYRAISDEGYESADLYYNMGNAAYRSNNIGHAILYYEKALKLDPSHEDARHNLEFVSRYRVDTFEPVPELFLRNWVRSLVRALSERTWSILAILLFLLILGCMLIYLFSHRLGLKKAGFFTALFGVLLFSVAFAAALARHRNIVNPESGVITAPSVTVRSSPSETGTELFILHEGTKVRVNEEVSGWQNIRVVDGREGWIGTGDFESI